MKTINLSTLFALLLAVTFFNSCKKDKPDPDKDLEKVLIIDNGARSIAPDEPLTYSASFVFEDGSRKAATGVSWSSSVAAIASVSSAGVVSTAGIGSVTVTASVTEGSVTYTTQAPLGIVAPSVFAVVPSAIIWEVGGEIQLETVYLGISNPTYSFVSSDANVATVDNNGLIRFQGTGSCTVTVTASSAPNSPAIVPIVVVGPPQVTLPVTKINITPASADLFRQETAQLTAQASNSNGPVSATFSWSSSAPNIVSVDANGQITAQALGSAYIYATAKGITGQAEIYVSPDTVIEVTPFMASIPAGGTQQFIAKAYNIRNGVTLLPGITQFDWAIPTYGFGVFDFASVNNAGLVSVNNNALIGNLTFVIASIPGNPDVAGVGSIMVSLCNCGPGNANVSSISIASGLSLNLFGNPSGQLVVTAKDANGNTVSNPNLRYCSDNTTIALVDEFTGEVTGLSVGNANIRVCSGGFAEATTSVTVSF